MKLIDKWNKFAKKRIYINEKFEISCGRLVFCIIVMILGIFQIPIAWLVPAFAIKKRNNEDNKQNESQ